MSSPLLRSGFGAATDRHGLEESQPQHGDAHDAWGEHEIVVFPAVLVQQVEDPEYVR